MSITWIMAAVYFALALGASIFLGPVVIPQLRKLKFGQAIREEGPQSHMSKQGTPTMGGFIFLTAFLFVMAVFFMNQLEVVFVMLSLVLFGGIGFLDDYIKVIRKHNLGLKSKQKLGLQLLASIILTIFASQFGTDTHLPFHLGNYDLGIWFFPLVVFIFLAVDNAVNLTDGLDGLATSVTVVVIFFYAVVAAVKGETALMWSAFAFAGALIGYLKFNWHPAKVFMGDTGSLALGGVVAAYAIALKIPFFIPIVGLIYVIENLSVIIQVLYYKKTKKRFFKMAPIHHHFELSGWREVKIVLTFAAVTAVAGVVSLLVL
ncbi:phospho-N-acetylmuramoyl-pentapeptide-transferase [Fusibacter paucivorans]|nr:phospho-N-acetylmuramoyl-pentapeptide-transferase [Fusibacter paucivorans]